jgi:hypothetical protein
VSLWRVVIGVGDEAYEYQCELQPDPIPKDGYIGVRFIPVNGTHSGQVHHHYGPFTIIEPREGKS